MVKDRFFTSGRVRAAATVVALGMAMGVGGGVAAANQSSPKSESTKRAVLATPRSCGAPTTYTNTSQRISVSVKACLESRSASRPFEVLAGADVDVKAGAAPVAYCRIDVELWSVPRAPLYGGGSQHNCTDSVNLGVRDYRDSFPADGAPGTYASRVSVLFGTNKGPVRVVVAQYQKSLS